MIYDPLQQNREQVAQAYFEIWTIEVGLGVKNNSSVDFEIFVFLHTLICLSPPCNFLLIFKHFSTKKNSAFSAACHIQNCRNRKLVKTDFSKEIYMYIYILLHFSSVYDLPVVLAIS